MSQPSISNEFTIPLGLIGTNSIQPLQREIKTWKQSYENVQRMYSDCQQGIDHMIDVNAEEAKDFEDHIKLLNKEISTMKEKLSEYDSVVSDLQKENNTLRREVYTLKYSLPRP